MKNYVKIFEEENLSLIKKIRTNVRIAFVFLVGVLPLVSAFFLFGILKDHIYLDDIYLDDICITIFSIWLCCALVGAIFACSIEKYMKRSLKTLAGLFAKNILIVDLINLLRARFTFEVSNEFIQNSAHGYEYSLSKEDWLSSYSFKDNYLIYFREFIFTTNNLKYKLTKVLYRNNKPFRFYFDITHPDGRVESKVEFEF
jgi:hypothetical protein